MVNFTSSHQKDSLKILLYTGHFNHPTFISLLGKYLHLKGHQVMFMGFSARYLSFKKQGIRYFPLPYPDNYLKFGFRILQQLLKLIFKRPSTLKSVGTTLNNDYQKNKGRKGFRDWLMDFIRLSACKLYRADLIHNQWSPALKALEPLFYHYPIVQSLHGRLEDVTPFHDPTVSAIYKTFFPRVSGFQSDSMRLLKNADYFGAKTENSFVSYSLVEQKRLKEEEQELNASETLKILSVGKFVWRKGYIHALDAMKILKNQAIPFQYTIIGWDDPTEIHFHIQDLGLEKDVFIKSQLKHEEVYENLNNADLLLIPSVEEGFATVATEGMATGTPVISTECGGMAELIESDKNGWLVPTRDPYAIAEILKTFNNIPIEKKKEVIQNARSLVQERLTWENEIDRYIQLYYNALHQ